MVLALLNLGGAHTMRDSNEQQPPRLPQLRVRFQSMFHSEQKSESSVHSNSSGDEMETKTAEATRTTTPAARKKPRYLSDVDRSVIIQRLESGAKQADLAREFGVTRAAISHINKHKHELLTRFDTFARSPHGRVLIENYTRPSTEFESVTEVRTAPASVLLTRIIDRETTPASFHASTRRLMRLLLEEALLRCGSVGHFPTAFASAQAVSVSAPPTGIAIGQEGLVLLEVFSEMEPEASTGLISATERHGNSTNRSNWRVLHVDIPSVISTQVLLLIPELVAFEVVAVVIEELRSRGVQLTSITVVCVLCADDAVRGLVDRENGVRVITASIERSQGAHHRSFTARCMAARDGERMDSY